MEIYQKDFESEKNILKDIFESDAKNYHACSYRIWLVEKFNLWEGELEFINHLLNEDV
jgi:protein farnesyltransferase/geranylgeranyltransferase type-1 subunit alpha